MISYVMGHLNDAGTSGQSSSSAGIDKGSGQKHDGVIFPPVELLLARWVLFVPAVGPGVKTSPSSDAGGNGTCTTNALVPLA